MKHGRKAAWLLLAVVLLLGCDGDPFPRLPGAIMLGGWPGAALAVTTPDETIQLPPHPEEHVWATLSADGKLVAYARMKPDDYKHVVLATYSIPTRTITEYAEGQFVGSIAISPDDSKIAFVQIAEPLAHAGRLQVMDLVTRKRIDGPAIPVIMSRAFLSWSPDSTRIVYDGPTVWDVRTGQVSEIGRRMRFTAWAPSGEWIAGIEQVGTSTGSGLADWLALVRPDGSGHKLVFKLNDRGAFRHDLSTWCAPVWSPDSKAVALNATMTEEGFQDISVIDIAHRTMTMPFHHKAPLLGWAVARK